jgi:hypothetical protein
MLTQDDLKSIKKLLQPLKEDVEVIKSKTTKIDSRQHLMAMQVSDLGDKLSVLNEKVEDGFKQTLKYVDEVEKEQVKDKKRITKLEEKLGLSSAT